MANEKRLIDANAFIEALENADADVCETYHDCYCDWGFSRKAIEDLLLNIPTVDAVEVVRCKDCKHALENPFITGCTKLVCSKWVNWRAVEPNHFCSYGERKDNG